MFFSCVKNNKQKKQDLFHVKEKKIRFFSSTLFHTEKNISWKTNISIQFLKRGKNDPEIKTISRFFFLFHSISHMEKSFTEEKNVSVILEKKKCFSWD